MVGTFAGQKTVIKLSHSYGEMDKEQSPPLGSSLKSLSGAKRQKTLFISLSLREAGVGTPVNEAPAAPARPSSTLVPDTEDPLVPAEDNTSIPASPSGATRQHSSNAENPSGPARPAYSAGRGNGPSEYLSFPWQTNVYLDNIHTSGDSTAIIGSGDSMIVFRDGDVQIFGGSFNSFPSGSIGVSSAPDPRIHLNTHPNASQSDCPYGRNSIYFENGIVNRAGFSQITLGPGTTFTGSGGSFEMSAQPPTLAKLPDLGTEALTLWGLNHRQKQTIGKEGARMEIEKDVSILNYSIAKALGEVCVKGALHVKSYSKLDIPESLRVNGSGNLDEAATLKATKVEIEEDLIVRGGSRAELKNALICRSLTLSAGSQVGTGTATINGSLVVSGGSQFCASGVGSTLIGGSIIMSGGSQVSCNGLGALTIGGKVTISGGSQLDLSQMKAGELYKLELMASGGSQIIVKKGIDREQISHWKLFRSQILGTSR